MISPELIAGMLFMPCMEDNEAIEVVGAERFSKYKGYVSKYNFNHLLTKILLCILFHLSLVKTQKVQTVFFPCLQ